MFNQNHSDHLSLSGQWLADRKRQIELQFRVSCKQCLPKHCFTAMVYSRRSERTTLVGKTRRVTRAFWYRNNTPLSVVSYPGESSPKAYRQPVAQAELGESSIWMKNQHTVHNALFKKLLWISMKIFWVWPISRTRTSASSRSIRKFPGGFRELKSSNIRLQIWEFKSRDRLTIRELKKSLWI